MAKFSVDPLKENSLMYLYAIRDEIDFNPSYQRQGDIWPASKKALLIDSLLNGFDIPKIYFHDVQRRHEGKNVRFAVIDGKQRLEAIFDFLDGKFSVASDFQDMAGVFGEFAGKYYKDFSKINLKLKARFESLPLPVHIVKTTDTDLIEEMFSRLNEASPLNAAEKRNAFGGPITDLIHELSSHTFFKETLPFANRRYKHYDVLCKFLLLTERGRVVDTKRIHLDKFVRSFEEHGHDSVQSIRARTLATLDMMAEHFEKKDKLFKLVTMAPIYYALAMVLISRDRLPKLDRKLLMKFEEEKRSNRELAQDNEESEEINYDWLEYDRLTQSPNDSSSIEFKINVLLSYLGESAISNKSLQ
jgi:hypothetical protein